MKVICKYNEICPRAAAEHCDHAKAHDEEKNETFSCKDEVDCAAVAEVVKDTFPIMDFGNVSLFVYCVPVEECDK